MEKRYIWEWYLKYLKSTYVTDTKIKKILWDDINNYYNPQEEIIFTL
jgi:hypothetical protein